MGPKEENRICLVVEFECCARTRISWSPKRSENGHGAVRTMTVTQLGRKWRSVPRLLIRFTNATVTRLRPRRSYSSFHFEESGIAGAPVPTSTWASH